MIFSILRLFGALCAVLLPCAATFAQSPEGVWLTENGDALIDIERCGDGWCGSIVWMLEPFDKTGRPRRDVANPDRQLRDRPVLGLRILEGFSLFPNEKGTWRGGRIYDAKSGRTYRCTLKMIEPDHIAIRGYVLIPLLGKNTHWTRVTVDDPSAGPGSVAEKQRN